ncbi:SEC-C domain-containing protein [Chryseobacterium binzhouense]|uniref:SEC-C domain-containing protein n=1 Tax=Chryseobacterium binzhouense TaxID=2593646 RepID=UPI00289B0034|nr:SEC-C domain-containing protein [Chryseobacterium binzhouense]
MRIARNEKCPCGSGLKYKKCCINKPKSNLKQMKPSNKKEQSTFFSKFDELELLKTFAGLSILPQNHGKNIRLDELVVRSFLCETEGTSNPDSNELNKFLTAQYPSHHMEDLCTNTFTDLITFLGGDYIIFPGITENGQELLSNQLGSIFHWPNSAIPEWFKDNTVTASLFMLGISDLIAKRLKYIRYILDSSDTKKLFVPDNNKLEEAKSAIFISNDEMTEFLEKKNISPEIVELFTIDPEKEINESSIDPFNNAILYKPILKTEEGYVILSPTTICLSLSHFIWNMAENNQCMKEVNDAYHAFTWNNLQFGLSKLEFDLISIPEISLDEDMKAGFYQFDNDKIAFIRYLGDSGKNYYSSENGFEGTASLEGLGQPKKIISALRNIEKFKDFKIFSISIPSVIGGDLMYSIIDDGADEILAMPIQELNVLIQLRNVDSIDLWKFSKAQKELRKSNPFFFSFSTLDLLKVFVENSNSFYLSDESANVAPVAEPGYAQDWFIEAKTKTDKHSVLRKNGSNYSFVGVEKKDSFMPVYYNKHEVLTGNPCFVVEGYDMPIWVIPEKIPSVSSYGLKSLYFQISEGISYWLWQIRENIKECIKPLCEKPFEIKFEFDNSEKFDVIERNYKRVENLETYFKVSLEDDGFTLVIPSEIIAFLYGGDNEGERVLVRQLLKGFNESLSTKGFNIIPEAKINETIENDVPLGMKKKFYILDTVDNLLMDPTNLKEYRYIQEYDSEKVLDQIVGLLGDKCPPVGEISTKDERLKLTRAITNDALFGLLKAKLENFNSLELLQRLVGLNESLIRKRELLKIEIPTRIACFVTEEQQIEDVYLTLAKLNRTTVSVRCLIEHLAAEQKDGEKIASTTDVDKLIAIMDQIIKWGSISDMIYFDLFDVKMSILPSGRIGTIKQDMADVFDPYHKSKTSENVQDTVSAFDQIFAQNIQDKNVSDVPEKLDKAFITDYGVSFTRICYFIDILSLIGFKQDLDYASLTLDKLKTEINSNAVDKFSDSEFDSVLDYLSLEKRGAVHKLPKNSGFEISDIVPFKYNRMLSLLRKPLIIFGEKDSTDRIVMWGARQVLDSKRILADQCQSGRLRVPKKESAIISVLGAFAQERGDGLVKAIIASIDPTNLLIDQEIFIGPGFEFKHFKDIGDIDVLIIDPSKKILFSLESKSMSPSRNIMEMVSEVNKLFGNDGESGWVDKHMDRDIWLKNNKDQITKKYGIDITDYEIRSFFVTEEDMLTPHLRKMQLPLPFITRYELEKHGYQALFK